MKQFSRSETLERLWGKIGRREAIIVGGAGCGLVGAALEAGGIDLIMAYNTGPYRMDGHVSLTGYRPFSDSNADTLRLGEALDGVVRNTPVIAGIGPSDPYRSFDRMLDACDKLHFSGVTNVPSVEDVADTAYFKDIIQSRGYGWKADVELLRACRKRDIFTIFYAFDVEELRALLAEGIDCVSVHVGGTVGGLFPAPEGGQKTFDQACEKTRMFYDIVQQENPNAIFLTHGGPFEDPASVGECFRRVPTHGFIGASTIERIPVESSVYNRIREYQALRLKARV